MFFIYALISGPNIPSLPNSFLLFSDRLTDLSKNQRPLTYCLTPSSFLPPIIEHLGTPAVSRHSFLFRFLFLLLSTTLLFHFFIFLTFYSLILPTRPAHRHPFPASTRYPTIDSVFQSIYLFQPPAISNVRYCNHLTLYAPWFMQGF